MISFQSLDEVRFFVKFIKLIYPKYLLDFKLRFNNHVQNILIELYEFLRQHNSEWAICTGLVFIIYFNKIILFMINLIIIILKGESKKLLNSLVKEKEIAKKNL